MGNGIEDAQPPHGGMEPAPDDEPQADSNDVRPADTESEEETEEP